MFKCQFYGQKETYIHFGEKHLSLDCYNEKMHQELGVKLESYLEGVDNRAPVYGKIPFIHDNYIEKILHLRTTTVFGYL